MPGISKAKELREKRANLAARMNELLDAGELTAETRAEFDKLHQEQNTLKTQIDEIEAEEAADHERIAEARKLAAEMNQRSKVIAGRQDTVPEDRAERPDPKAAEERAFMSYLRFGMEGLSSEDRGFVRGRYAQMAEQRAQGTNVDTAGGFLVPEGFYGRIVEAMKFYGGMRQARSTILTTDSGNVLPIPTNDDTSNTGAILTENPSSAVSQQDLTIGQRQLFAYTYTSKMVLVSWEILMDSAFDLQALLSRKLGERIGRIQNTHFTTGDANSKPQGVVTGATQGKAGATGQTTTVLVDDLIALEHSIDIAYRRAGAEWMMNDASIQVLKQLKDGEGRPIWLPGVAVNAPDRILGYPYVVNNDVATMAASAKSILFGDFSNYFIRDVRGIAVRRLDERFADTNQVAFLAFARADGGLIDAGQNPIKYYQNSAS